MTRRLWFRASVFSVVGIATSLLAIFFREWVPASFAASIGADSVDKILGIIASSMLAVTTFSLSTMVSAYGAASSGVTPRATTLVMEDSTTQNALATFIGSFLFSLVGIIALSTGAYGAQGRVVLFAVTLLVVALIVYTLLRWIDHLSKLGRMGETIDRVEKAAIEALQTRATWPFMGGVEYPVGLELPATAATVTSVDTGYIQHVDIGVLGALADAHEVEIYLEVLPGSFVHVGMPVAHLVWKNPESAAPALDQKIRETLTLGVRRTFDQDPRFCLAVLAEIATRALSPATNDSGTVIDVIGRGVRCFSSWAEQRACARDADEHCHRVHVRGLQVHDLFDDFFTLIARDGAGLLEVDIRLTKALGSLTAVDPELFSQQCSKQLAMLLKRAESALQLDEEKVQLKALADTQK